MWARLDILFILMQNSSPSGNLWNQTTSYLLPKHNNGTVKTQTFLFQKGEIRRKKGHGSWQSLKPSRVNSIRFSGLRIILFCSVLCPLSPFTLERVICFTQSLLRWRWRWKWSHCRYPTLCNPVDCSLPGSSVHGILQARILEWVAISFSRGSPRPRDWTQVSRIGDRCFNLWATREAKVLLM